LTPAGSSLTRCDGWTGRLTDMRIIRFRFYSRQRDYNVGIYRFLCFCF